MKRKVRAVINTSRKTFYTHPFVSLISLIFGVLATIIVTHVFAQQASQQIYACVQNHSGNVRIVDQNTNCRSDETSLSWNIQGPQGIQGPPGSSGGGPLICPGCSFDGNLGYNGYVSPQYNQLSGKDLSNSYLVGARIAINVNVSGSNISNSILDGIIFAGTNATGANFSGTKMHASSLVNSNFTNANFTGADLSTISYSGGSGAGIARTDFTNANLTGANFTNANLTGANGMGTATITNVTWSNTICPDITNSNSHSNTCVGHF